MNFHWPSFLLGVATGAVGAQVAPRLRPVAVELAATAYRMFDSFLVGAAIQREDLDDVLAEARARAQGEGARKRSARPQAKRTRPQAKRARPTARTRRPRRASSTS